jgi:hypothetical protein
MYFGLRVDTCPLNFDGFYHRRTAVYETLHISVK